MLVKKDTDSVSAWRLLTAKRFSAVDGPKAAIESSPSITGLGLMGQKLLVSAIRAYQYCSRAMGLGCCRFYPSCSEYAIEAIEKHGVFFGLFKGLKRILRCHPFSKGGYDPVT